MLAKIGPILILQNNGAQKLKLSENVNSESCSQNPIFFEENNV